MTNWNRFIQKIRIFILIFMSSYEISIYLKVCILKKIMIYYDCMKKTPYEKGSWSNRLASFFVFKNIK